MTAVTPLLRWTPVFRPPTESAIRISVHCVLIAVLCFTLLLSAGLGRDGGAAALFRDTDDFMRMVQVLDWIDGQGWTDTVQRRLDPPAGVDMHWSRLADLPLATVISLTEPWLGRAKAIHLSALTVPPFLGGLLVLAFLWGAAALTPGRQGPLPIATVATLLIPLQYMLPGRIDHHGLQLVLTALAVGLLIRSLQAGKIWASVGLGLVGGVALAIGLEALPLLGAATVIVSLAWVSRGGTAARTLTYFGAALSGMTLVLLFLTLPREAWAATACDRMSLAHVAMTASVLAAGGAAIVFEHLRPGSSWLPRLITVTGSGIAGLAFAAAAFPECAGSPYAGLPEDVKYWFVRVNEAQSLTEYFRRKPGLAVSAVILPVTALIVVGWQWIGARDRSDPKWLALGVLAMSGLAVTAWQIRGMAYAGLVAGFAFVPLAVAVDERARRSARMWTRLGLRLCMPLVCVVAVVTPARLQPGPITRADEWKSQCDVPSVLAELTDPAEFGAREQTIAAPIDAGPSILFLTRHKVLAGPYHRNVRGLADNRRIFAGTEDQALATIEARGVDAIFVCRKFIGVSTYGHRPAFLEDRLASNRPPWWLVPVTKREGMALYEVHPAANAAR